MKIKNICYFFFLFLASLFVTSCSLFKDKEESVSTDKLDLSTLYLEYKQIEDIVYDGKAKEVEIYVKDRWNTCLASIYPNVESNDFKVEYTNNVNAGVASVEVIAKESSLKFIGSNTLFFTIDQAITTSNDLNDLCEKAKSGNYSKIEMTSDIVISENVELEIVSSTLVTTNFYHLTNYGRIINYGFLVIENEESSVDFINYGYLLNEGSVSLLGCQVINVGTFINNKQIISSSYYPTIYTNSDISNIYSDNISLYRRYDIEDYTINIEDDSFFYTGEEIKPKITLEKDGTPLNSADYETIYSNNIEVGEATVRIVAKEQAKSLYGEKTINFIIEKSLYVASSEEKLISALDNPNYYGVFVINKTLDQNFTIPEDKLVYLNKSIVNGEIEVKGQIVVDEGNLIINNTITLDEKGKIINNSIINLKKEIVGQGIIINNGNIYFYEEGDSSCLFENNGSIYVNDDSQITWTGSGEVINRIRIKEDDVLISNNYSKYDGTNIFPTIEFLNGFNLERTAYNIRIYNKETNQEYGFVTDKGQYLVVLSIDETSTSYCGTVYLDYEILYGEIHVNTIKEFNDALNNINYNKIYIDDSLSLTSKITIPSYLEVIIKEDVFVSNSMKIDVYGTITNYGYFAEGIKDGICLNIDAKINNFGTCYFNDLVPEGIVDNGQTIVRKSIEEAKIINFQEEVKYTTFHTNTQNIKMKLGDIDIHFSNYTEVYKNNTCVSDEEPALMIIQSNPFSEYIYGTMQLEFNVVGGEIEVSNLSELIRACSDIRSGSELCNWAIITFKEDIVETHEGYGITTIWIKKNTTVKLNGHSFTLRVGSGGRFKVVNDGVIEATKHAYMDFIFYEGKGKVIGYTFNEKDLMDLVLFCDEVYLTGDVEVTKGISLYPGSSSYHDVVLDLNGYQINGYVFVNVQRASIVIKNGTINNPNSSVSLSLDDYMKKYDLTLINLTIYGLSTFASENAKIEDCQIL